MLILSLAKSNNETMNSRKRCFHWQWHLMVVWEFLCKIYERCSRCTIELNSGVGIREIVFLRFGNNQVVLVQIDDDALLCAILFDNGTENPTCWQLPTMKTPCGMFSMSLSVIFLKQLSGEVCAKFGILKTMLYGYLFAKVLIKVVESNKINCKRSNL